MTSLTLSVLALSLAPALPSPARPECALPRHAQEKTYVFTNADLERMAACRYQTGAASQQGDAADGADSSRSVPKGAAARMPSKDALERDWRARWRSVDQKARRLRQTARELRQEAAEAPRDPKKRPVGRRSPSLLIAKAEALESEAKELEASFEETARREGALPGWLRP